MEKYSIIFVILAVITVCNGAWLAKISCNPATNATSNRGSVINGNCILQYDGSYLLYNCGPKDQIAVEFSCTDSQCAHCTQTASYKTNNGECNGENDPHMYMCFPKTVDYSKVIGTPGYVLESTFTSLPNFVCKGEPLESEVYSVGACMAGKDFNFYPYYMQFDSCSSTSVRLNQYLDPYCSSQPVEFVDVPLNQCTNDVQNFCYMK